MPTPRPMRAPRIGPIWPMSRACVSRPTVRRPVPTPAILTAIAGVGTGLLTVGLLTHALDIGQIGPILGALIGLGVGIDYALFIVTRHRTGLRSGMTVEESVVKAIDTSGRAVLFAGATVVIALLGMFVLGMSFLNGMAIASATTVVATVLADITLLTAMV